MQKNYMISCCGECPAFIRKHNLCRKRDKVVEQEASTPVDCIMLGFPDWCPLSDIEIVGGGLNSELRRIVRRVLKMLEWDADDSAVTSVANYLSTVVDVKGLREVKENDLFESATAEEA
jgi:hypothetical protein